MSSTQAEKLREDLRLRTEKWREEVMKEERMTSPPPPPLPKAAVRATGMRVITRLAGARYYTPLDTVA